MKIFEQMWEEMYHDISTLFEEKLKDKGVKYIKVDWPQCSSFDKDGKPITILMCSRKISGNSVNEFLNNALQYFKNNDYKWFHQLHYFEVPLTGIKTCVLRGA